MDFRMTRRELLGRLAGLLGGCAAALLGRWPDSKGTKAAGPSRRHDWVSGSVTTCTYYRHDWVPGSVTTYTYDSQGRLISESPAVQSLCQVRSGYGGLGRPVSRSYGEVIGAVPYEAGRHGPRG